MLLDNKLADVSISTLNIFCVSAEQESFVGASELLGLTPATVSRSISRLEKRLNVQLFARTTRKVKLTELGKDYYHACSTAIKRINDAENDIINGSTSPRGKLKISLPTTYGYFRLMPILVKFQQCYPDIALEIDFSNTNVDFIAQGFDISVRLGNIQDSRLVAKNRRCWFRCVCYKGLFR